jgi:hypothetical protein
MHSKILKTNSTHYTYMYSIERMVLFLKNPQKISISLLLFSLLAGGNFSDINYKRQNNTCTCTFFEAKKNTVGFTNLPVLIPEPEVCS